MSKLIAIVGMCGAGKSQVADYLVDKGFAYLRLGQITMDIIKERKLPVNEETEKKVREGIRQEHGMAAYAIVNIPKLNKLLAEHEHVVADGLYSWSEYKVLRDTYGADLLVLAVYAPPQLRYGRLGSRQHEQGRDSNIRFRPLSEDQAKQRDFAEIENIEKGGPIAMADVTIINDGGFDKLYAQLDTFLQTINT